MNLEIDQCVLSFLVLYTKSNTVILLAFSVKLEIHLHREFTVLTKTILNISIIMFTSCRKREISCPADTLP